VCGYPTRNGDLYGGGHYIELSSATLTIQGRAIKEASMKFGDGNTLPFTPCKKGYKPYLILPTTPSDENNNNNNNTGSGNDNSTMTNVNKKKKKKNAIKLYACKFHNEARKERLRQEKWVYRNGEMNLRQLFWSGSKNNTPLASETSSLTTTVKGEPKKSN